VLGLLLGGLAYSIIVTGKLVFFGFTSCFYFFNSITLTSLFFFCFFYSLVALLGIRLHQPDGECFPVLHQPSYLLPILSFFLLSFYMCSSHSILGLSLPLAPSSLVSHTCLGFLLSSIPIRCPEHLSFSCQPL